MSVNGVSATDDVDMAECDQEKVVTMMDVLQEQQEFEEDADAVLGASDDKNCTYFQGYIKRQAIYACLTCCEDAKTDPSKRAGVCLACSLSCHENHELVELYTKRNFRCDCGNPKFNSHPCQFVPEKPDLNEDNHYNQNFSGLYCTCHRPYPDPEFPVEDEMIQCIICEDWLHACHLEAVVPANEQYAEMICKGCMDKNEFLHDYSDIAVTAESDEVDVVNATNTDISMTKDSSECNGNLEKELLNGSVEMSDINEKVGEDVECAKDEKMDSDLSNDTKINDENIPAGDTESAENVLDANNIQKESDSLIEPNEEQNKDDNTSLPKDIVNEAASKVTTNDKAESSTSEPEDKSKDEATNDVKNMNKSEINIDDEEKEKCDAEKVLTKDPTDKIEQNNENLLPENEQKQLSEEKPEADKDINQDSTEKIEQSNKDQSTENLQQLSKETLQESETLEASNESSMNVDQEENKTDVDKNKESSDTIKNNDSAEEHLETEIETKNAEESLETVPETNDAADKEMSSEKDKDKSLKETVPETNEVADKEESSKGTVPETNEVDDKEITSENDKEESSKGTVPETNEVYDKEIASEKDKDESLKETVPEINDVADMEMSSEKDKHTKAEDKSLENDNAMDTDEKEKKVESLNGIENGNVGTSDLKDNSDMRVSDNTLEESKLTSQTPDVKESKRKLSTEELLEEVTTKKPKLVDSEACLRPKGVKRRFKGATFWPSQFRQKLCTCNECISMYKDLSVLFLIDPEDTVSAYETLGKEKTDGTPASQYEKGLQALSSLDRIQQINALTEYNRMRDKLLDFLKSFKDRKEVVKEEDIKAFFAGMKPKREPDGVYFCR